MDNQDKALARLADAIDNGTGWRVSADEVQTLAVTIFGEFAELARDRVKGVPDI